MLLVVQSSSSSSFHYDNPTKLLPPTSFHSHVILKPPRMNKNNDKKNNNLIVGYAGGEDPPRSGVAVEEIKTTTTKIPPQIQVSQGYPTPLGATLRDGGINFSISSTNSTCAILCLFNSSAHLYQVCLYFSFITSINYIIKIITLHFFLLRSEEGDSPDLTGPTYQ